MPRSSEFATIADAAEAVPPSLPSASMPFDEAAAADEAPLAPSTPLIELNPRRPSELDEAAEEAAEEPKPTPSPPLVPRPLPPADVDVDTDAAEGPPPMLASLACSPMIFDEVAAADEAPLALSKPPIEPNCLKLLVLREAEEEITEEPGPIPRPAEFAAAAVPPNPSSL